jgi:CHAD domain-containing protein
VADTLREVESKFDVAPDFQVGSLETLRCDGDRIEVKDSQLVSVYYDSAEHDLLRSRLTLRRRTGTFDTGWQLKVPGDGFRTELRWPLTDAQDPADPAAQPDQPPNADPKSHSAGMPDELRSLIAPFSHGNEVYPTVELKVNRLRHRVLSATGVLRFEIADDQVWATGLAAPTRTRRWHEVEVELGPDGTPDDLVDTAQLLLDRGAFASKSSSKLGRALLGTGEALLPSGAAGVALLDFLNAQCDAITAGHFAISLKPFDPDASSEPHEAVHQTRVATRRLRAMIRVFGPMFQPERAVTLERELKWFAAELGEVRDREVLRARIARALEELPAFLVVGNVGSRIDRILLTELIQHANDLLATMRAPRYHNLLDELVQWRSAPPFTSAATLPVQALDDYVEEAARQLAKRMRRAASRGATDETLHTARKAGKRTRYASELISTAQGDRRDSLAKTASDLQTLLGEQQDAVVATELIRRVADQVADEGGNAFTYGILVADQRRDAAEAVQAARKLAKRWWSEYIIN